MFEDVEVALARLQRLEETAANAGVVLSPELMLRREQTLQAVASQISSLADAIQGAASAYRCAGCCG